MANISYLATDIDETISRTKATASGVLTITTPSQNVTSYTNAVSLRNFTFNNPVVIATLNGDVNKNAMVNASWNSTSKTILISIFNSDGLLPNATYTISYIITEAN